MQAGGRNRTTYMLGSAFPMDGVAVRTELGMGKSTQQMKVPGVKGT